MQIGTTRAALGVSAVVLAMIFAVPSVASAQPFVFSTGNPDGKMALASRPDSPGKQEIEAADDFVLTSETAITHATFTGLLPASGSVQAITLEIYRVFPLDSNTAHTPVVPTRVNSPSDVDFQSRSSGPSGQLSYSPVGLASSLTVANSILNGIHPAPNQATGGDGPVTGQEVQFKVTLTSPFILPAGHYFFVPQVQVSGPVTSNFYWLSAPHPIVAPGTPFPAATTDLQAWIRNSALDPDWLRAGTDIVGGTTPPTFNAAFTLDNAPLSLGFSGQPLPGRIGVRLAVRAPAAGTVQALDPEVGKHGKNGHKAAWFKTVTVKVSHAGVVHLRLVPDAAGLKQLAKKNTIHVRVQLSFTPTGGQSSIRTITITWHRK